MRTKKKSPKKPTPLEAFDAAKVKLDREHRQALEALDASFEGKASGPDCVEVVRRYLDERQTIEDAYDAALHTAFLIASGKVRS